MAGNTTITMLRRFEEIVDATLFLLSFFKSGPENKFEGQKVEYDVERSGREVAVVLTNVSDGYRGNEDEIFTNKTITPPSFGESFNIDAYNMQKRQPGEDPYKSPRILANALKQITKKSRKIMNKIMRAIELQASQVLQTGTLTFIDESGATLFTLDYKPKATHFPTVAVGWDQASADPLTDLEDLAKLLRKNGKVRADTLVFGATAWNLFLGNSIVKDRANFRRVDMVDIKPPEMPSDLGNFQGTISVGTFKFNIFLYDGSYDHIQTGVDTPYVDDDKVIMLSSKTRLDMLSGTVPRILEADPRLQSLLDAVPSRVQADEGRVDFSVNAATDKWGENVEIGEKTVTVLVPTQIDGIGAIDVLP